MTNEQLVELIQMDIDVKENLEKLYQQNITILKKICNPYTHIEPLEDLLQQSYFGILESIPRYDASQGYKWLTYARFWIEQNIQRYIISCGRLIRIPPHMNDLLFKYRRFLSAYAADHKGLLPPDEEIRQELNISKEQLADLKKYALYGDMRSLDSPIDEAGEITLLDAVASPDSMEENAIDNIYLHEMKEDVEKAMQIALTPAEQDTIKAYYWHGGTLATIAKEKDVSRERVRQQLANAQRKLTRGKAGKILKEYAKISCVRYYGGFSFFKSHGSVVEYEAILKDQIYNNAKARYEEMKRQEQERQKERLANAKAI